MTSGNVSDEPIAYRDDDARERLAPIADLFLLHDRPIETRTDDSVVRNVEDRPTILRRSRGHVPDALPLPGAPLPPARVRRRAEEHVCAGKGRPAWVGHHIGDLKNYETLDSFATGIDHFQRLFAIEPEVVAHDLHPEYLSTKYARELEGVELVGCAAPPRSPRGLPGGARRDRPGARRDLRRHRLRRRTGPSGAASSWSAGSRASSGSASCSPSGCRAARRRSASRGAWRAHGSPRSRGHGPPPKPLAALVDGGAWEQVEALLRSGIAVAGDHERRPPLRRRRGAVRHPR